MLHSFNYHCSCGECRSEQARRLAAETHRRAAQHQPRWHRAEQARAALAAAPFETGGESLDEWRRRNA